MSNPSASPFTTSSPSRLAKSRLRLFNTIRRLLLRNCSSTSSTINAKNNPTLSPPPHRVNINPEESLIDIIKRHELEDQNEKSKAEMEFVMTSSTDARQKRAVKEIVFGKGWEEKERAAREIERLTREHAETRKSLAELGVIPPLVAMAADPVSRRRGVAVRALLQLAKGSVTNTTRMVEAGILSAIPNEPTKLEEPTKHDLAILIMSISSLPNTAQLPLDPSPILPFLSSVLNSTSTPQLKDACLTSLYNLSTILENSPLLVTNDVVNILLNLSSTKPFSEKSLATLGNLVITSTGKKAMENHPLVPENLIEIVGWEDKPKCQELSLYILMILAHQSSKTREKMEASGIVPVLLEVGLLGSALAQKRALRLLQWFKDERGNDRLRHCLSPQLGLSSTSRDFIGSPVSERENKEGKKLIKRMVKQSLYRNMEVITRRANLPSGEQSSSRLKSLIVSSSSKSLPY